MLSSQCLWTPPCTAHPPRRLRFSGWCRGLSETTGEFSDSLTPSGCPTVPSRCDSNHLESGQAPSANSWSHRTEPASDASCSLPS